MALFDPCCCWFICCCCCTSVCTGNIPCSNRSHNPIRIPCFRYDGRQGPKKLKQAKLCQFAIFLIQSWTILCLNCPSYNWLLVFDCTDLSSICLKKEHFCSKIFLGQTWLFKFYSTENFLFLTTTFWNWNMDWMVGFTTTSTTVPCNSIKSYCMFML